MQADCANPSAPVFLVACFIYTVSLTRLAKHSQKQVIHPNWLLLVGLFAVVVLGILNLKAHEPRGLMLLKYVPLTVLLAAVTSVLFALVGRDGTEGKTNGFSPSEPTPDDKWPLFDKDGVCA